MMKFRIKVFPHEGRLLYMPQRKCLFGWKDMIHSYDGKYVGPHHMYLQSERTALEWIEGVISYEKAKQAKQEKKIAEKKFARANPVKYIEVHL